MLTIPNLSIQKIERVQNKTLYKKYLLETLPIIKRFNLGNKKEVYKREAEIYGWHGTSANPPENIYKNNGFDISFSRDSGYFGRAIYFANDALYSATTYSFTNTRGNTKCSFFRRSVLENQSQWPRKNTSSRLSKAKAKTFDLIQCSQAGSILIQLTKKSQSMRSSQQLPFEDHSFCFTI